jgi:spermidine synthase
VAGWGAHILASSEPIEQLDANQLASRMPESAKKDLLEWNDSQNAPAYIGLVVNREVFVPRLLNPDPKVQITDDRPYNEYFLLRRLLR